jgi:hypothetical protein
MSKNKDHPTSMLVRPTRPAAAAPEDNHPMDQVEQGVGKANPNARAARSRFEVEIWGASKHLTFGARVMAF